LVEDVVVDSLVDEIIDRIRVYNIELDWGGLKNIMKCFKQRSQTLFDKHYDKLVRNGFKKNILKYFF
jgi:hypothetical protein